MIPKMKIDAFSSIRSLKMPGLKLFFSRSFPALLSFFLVGFTFSSLGAGLPRVTQKELSHMKAALDQMQAQNQRDAFSAEDFFSYFDLERPDFETTGKSLQKIWYKRQMLWNNAYDDFIVAKQTYIMDATLLGIREHFNGLEEPAKKEALAPVMENLESKYREWNEHRSMIGRYALAEADRRDTLSDDRLKAEGIEKRSSQQLQMKRKYSFDGFFQSLKRYFRIVDGTERPDSGSSSALVGYPVSFAKGLGVVLVSSVAAIISMPFYVFTRNKTPMSSFFFSVQRWMDRSDRKFGKLVVEHKGPLEPSRAEIDEYGRGRLVNLVIPSHRDDVGDNHLAAAMKLSNAVIFGNAAAVGGFVDNGRSGRLAANIIASVPEFVAVGTIKGFWGQSTPEKFSSALQSRESPNVINYAQGFVADFHEILEITPQFSGKLVKPLLDQGYQVRITPVSYEIESRFFRSASDPVSELPYGLVVNKSLKPELVSYMMQLELNEGGFDKLLSVFMRSTWFNTIKRYGELSLSEISERIQKKTGFGIVASGA